MKKIALTLSVVALLAACRKPTEKSLSVTETTGTSTFKGVVTKNIFVNNNGTFQSNGQVPAMGAKVICRVAKNALYPGSQALGYDTYMTTTDAQGMYSLDIKVAGNSGTSVGMVIETWTGTLDTLLNGVIKTGQPARFDGTSNTFNVQVGQTQQVNHHANAVLINSNPNNNNMVIGMAMVSGTVGMANLYYTRAQATSTVANSTSTVYTSAGTTLVPVPSGTKVYMSFSKDPYILMDKMYQTTTATGGAYNFTMATVAMNTPGMNQNASIWVADLAGTQDTIKVTAPNTSSATALPVITGKSGVFGNVMINSNGLFNNENRNGQNINLTGFIAN